MLEKKIIVPRFVDDYNYNAQNLNVKEMLSRFDDPCLKWLVTYMKKADSRVGAYNSVQLVRLWRGRLWRLRMFLFYLQPSAGLFYPGGVPYAGVALRIRKWLYPSSPVIGTLEGLAGTEERERRLTELSGHPVYCHGVEPKILKQIDSLYRQCDHIIAISPFLAKMGRHLYGDKFSVVPLGINGSVFYPSSVPLQNKRVKVVSAGTFQARKRPELFCELARRHPEADFVWYGDGVEKQKVIDLICRLKLKNIDFPGSATPKELANVFRSSDIFVMPSSSEGVPKVTQEAAACGLPVILFGYYEAHSVIDGENGFVAWNDDDFFQKCGKLIHNKNLAAEMGARGARMAKEWNWDTIATKWKQEILSKLED